MKFEKYLFVFVYDRDKGDESMDTGDTVKPEKDDEFYGEFWQILTIYTTLDEPVKFHIAYIEWYRL